MERIERRPVTPGQLADLVKAETYRLRYQNIWPSRNAWRHFLRSRREELFERGLVVELSAGYFVVGPAMDEALPELLGYGHSQAYRHGP